MKTSFIIIAVLFSLASHAQTGLQRTYSTGIANSFIALLPGSNGYVMAGTSNFGYDSTWLHLIFLDANGDVSSQKSWRNTLPLSFMDNATSLTNGFLVCGIGSPNFGDFHPYLIKTDNNGTAQWAKWFDNLGFSSHQLNALVPNGNNFTVYSYPDGPTEGFYRIEGDETGNSFSATSVTNPSSSMRIYNAKPFATVTDHLLIGTGSIAYSGTGPDGLLIKMDASSIAWSKLFDFGSHIFFDGFQDAVITTGDNPIVVGYSQVDSNSVITSFVMKINSSGTITWCKQLALDNLLDLFSIVETSSGDLIVSGLDAGYRAILVKLSSNGDLIWSRRWTPPTYGITFFPKLNRDATTNEIIMTATNTGSFAVLHLDANGDGCEFEDVSTLTATDFSPTIQDLALTATSFSPTTQTETLYDRTVNITTQDLCHTGIEGVDLNQSPVITPNPADDVMMIYLPSTIAKATVNILDATGRQVCSFIQSNTELTFPVSSFSPGIYLVEIVSGKNVWVKKLVKE